MLGLVQSKEAVFITNQNDEASFPRDDVIHKLPKPTILGGSARRKCQITFNCNLEKWKLN